jgi:hypothetical protein
MNLRSNISILLAVALLIAACPVEGSGQEDKPARNPIGVTAPRLGETRIVQTSFLPDPFVNTRATMLVGYGSSGDIVTPLLEINGEPVVGLEGNLVYAILGFYYQYAIRDWMAAWVRVSMAARLGNELQTILAQGLSAFSGFEIGWLFRLYETDRHLLSTSLMVRNSDTSIIELIGWVEGIIEGEDVDLLRKSPTLATVADLRYIYAISNWTAVQLSGQLSYGEAIDRRVGNDWYYGGGGILSLDFNRRTGFPVGLAGGYKYTTIPEGGDDIADHIQSVLIGISYMGRPDFHLGLDLEFQRMPVRRVDDTTSFFTAMISMEYYF